MKMVRKRGRAAVSLGVALVAAVCFAPRRLGAQTVTGTLQGAVTDTTGGVVPGVTIVLQNKETGHKREVVTNAQGYYHAPFLPIGPYRVTTSLAGFGRQVQENVQIRLNATSVADFTLRPATAEEVTVVAERPPLNTTNAEIKQSLTSEQIMDKPTFQNLNSAYGFLTLAETFAGFQENPTSGQNNPTLSSGSSINFNGTGTRGATFQIDGVNNDDSSENQNRQGVSLASIKEFQVISNTYSAEFGRGFGAVVLVQTKSGTNQIHGEAYFYRQDSDLNERAFFNRPPAPKPNNQRNNFGGVLGFPIKKDKLHGFVTYDRARQDGTGGYTRDFLLPAGLSGPRLTRGNDSPANRAFIENVLSRYPSTLTSNDPRNTGNVPGVGTFQGTVGFDRPVRDYSARLDWDPTARDHVVVRYQYSRQVLDNREVIVGEATKQNNRQLNGGLTWTHTFSPRTIGEFRYGRGVRDTNVDVKAGNDTPIVRFTASPVAGTTLGSAGNLPIHRDQVDNQIVYNLSTLFGNSHGFKAGVDARFAKLDDLADNFSRGFWTFNAVCGGQTYRTPYDAFLDGCVRTFQKGYGNFFLENRIREYNLYVEDNWKVTPRLTLNLGARYEYAGAPSEKENRVDYVFSDDEDNIQPRVGFAYAPAWRDGFLGWLSGGPGNFSIRGGYGLYHGRLFQSIFSQGGANVRFNPPNGLLRTFEHQTNLADPTNGFVFEPGQPLTVRASITQIDPELEMPRTHQWNLTFERKIPWNSTLRVSYNGVRGRGLLQYRQDNLPVSPLAGGIVVVNHPNNAPAAGAPDLRGIRIDRVAADVQCAGTGFIPGVAPNATCPVPVPIANNEVSLRVPRTNERRPDPRYTTNLAVSNNSDSWYDGLQVEWIKRASHGLRFEINYTFSKALDTGSEATFVGTGDSNILGPDKKFAKGLGRFHTPHRFTFNGTWQLPIFRGRTDTTGRILGGWSLSAVVKLSHGTPFTVIDTGVGDLNFDGFSENRPVLVDRSVLGRAVDDPDRGPQQLPREAFRRTTFADIGRDIVGRNTFFIDDVRNVDLGFYKTFGITHTHKLQTRLEAYNVFNRTQFGFPTVDLANANFGRVLSQQNGPRTMQLTFRYFF
jgi:outer membrane receptor protein involved in Fe transport